jgi:SAM-dependent methyltransferase
MSPAQSTPDAAPAKLHLGCGMVTPPGWLNVDGSWGAIVAKRPRLQKALSSVGIGPPPRPGVSWNAAITIHDLRKPFPWRDGSFDAVYASHTLEHLHLNEAGRVLRECLRVLRPGGVCRMVVPDLEHQIKVCYGPGGGGAAPDAPGAAGQEGGDWSGCDTTLAADRLLRMMGMRRPSPPSGRNPVYRLYRTLNDFRAHKWMYDERSLCSRFTEAGFTDVARRNCRDSRIDGIDAVELPDRVEDGGLAVEGVKPSR